MLKNIIVTFVLFKELALGYINIYPAFFYERIPEKGVFKKFTLTNRRSEKIKYRLYLEENVLRDVDIEIYPKSIILKPFEKSEVRVLIKKKKNSEKKEFTEKLIIKEVELPGQKKKILTMLKFKLSGFIGELSPKLQIQRNTLGKITLKNIGERTGIYDVYTSKEKYIDTIILKKQEEKDIEDKGEKLIFKEKYENK